MLLALGACSDSATDAATPTSAADAAPPTPLVARCRLTEERPPDPMATETAVAFSVEPVGTMLFTTQHAWNGMHVPGVSVDVAPITTDELASVVHTASGDLIADDHGVSLLTWTPVRKRTVFPLPSRGRDATLVETATGPVLLYARVDSANARRNRDDEEPAGALRWQRLDANGRPTGAALSLESQDPAFGDVLSFGAHAETGRVVIEVENAEAVTRFGVFDLDGNERSSGEGRDVLCPLAGCVRLVGRIDPRAPQLGGEDGQLRAEILSHGTALSFGLSADHVEAAVVRGNQVLAVLRTGTEGAVTRSLAVLDVPRHRAVPVSRAGSEDTVVSWMISSGATAPMLRVTDDGFAALHTDDTGRLVVQRVNCDR
jgi:hypothetical protein